MCFWLYTSGSTGRPKGAVHVHANLRLTADLYGGGVLGLQGERRLLFGGEAVLRLRARQRHDLSDGGRRDHRAARPTGRRPTASPRSCASIRSRCSTRCRPSMPPSSPARTRPSAARLEAALLHFRRRGAAARRRPALAGALRRRHPRRHRLDRDAAHLPLEPSRRREIRHHRQAGAGLRHPPRRRRRQRDQDQGRDGRAAGARADRRGHVLEQPRADRATTFLGEWTRSGDKYRRGRGRLLRLLRPARRHAQGRRHLCLAVRGRRRALHAIPTCWKPRSSPGRTRTS